MGDAVILETSAVRMILLGTVAHKETHVVVEVVRSHVFLHLLQLFRVPCDQIQKGQAFKVFCPLVGHLHNLMVSLHECRFPQSCPCGFVVQNLGRFQCNLN